MARLASADRWRIALVVAVLTAMGCCQPPPTRTTPPEEREQPWAGDEDLRATLRVKVDGQLVGGATATVEAVVTATDEINEYARIGIALPHDLEVVDQEVGTKKPLRAGESMLRRVTFRIPADDIERVVEVQAAASGGGGWRSWDASERLLINPGGRPRASWRCGRKYRINCHDMVSLDLEASAPLKPGTEVDLVVRGVELNRPELVTLWVELPPEIQVVSGTTRRGPITIRGVDQTEELKLRVKLPDDGQRRTIHGVGLVQAESVTTPGQLDGVGKFKVSLETLAR